MIGVFESDLLLHGLRVLFCFVSGGSGGAGEEGCNSPSSRGEVFVFCGFVCYFSSLIFYFTCLFLLVL